MSRVLSKPPQPPEPRPDKPPLTTSAHPPARPQSQPSGFPPHTAQATLPEKKPRTSVRFTVWPLAAGAIGVGAYLAYQWLSEPAKPASKPTPVRMVTLQTPPPPPPPPTPPPPKLQPPPPQEQKMIEQTPVAEEEPKPEPPQPADDPPPDLGTNIQGNGPADGFGLSGNRGTGGGTGKGLGGSGTKSSSRWGWYAAKVQSSIGDALRRNPRTREAIINSKVRVWPDSTGRITRAKLETSTGDAAMDASIIQTLTGIQLSEAPPADLPSPILLRLAARRP